MKVWIRRLLLVTLSMAASIREATALDEVDKKPNALLSVADDLGLRLPCHGVSTPTRR